MQPRLQDLWSMQPRLQELWALHPRLQELWAMQPRDSSLDTSIDVYLWKYPAQNSVTNEAFHTAADCWIFSSYLF
ncbi:hypothetical protein NDU88_008796 [Pleurodeles waltl]|uniref:Uncharacterized protein n=1 Tax=Pleurodeles waltl TaxID=8319 RepID=A0AAV7P1A8_PLEWA|nr:hypothetical protein NDU88_008796 [Pleurodeles waltl]